MGKYSKVSWRSKREMAKCHRQGSGMSKVAPSGMISRKSREKMPRASTRSL